MTIQKNRKKRVFLIAAAALALILVLTGIWTLFIEPNRLVVKEEAIELANWPSSFGNLKIAVLSDLHVGSPFIDAEKVHYIVSQVNQAQPDLIVLLGDFMIQGVVGGTQVEPESIAENLKGLRARHGVFAVLGNHDWWYDGPRVQRSLESVGIRVLENDVARIERDGQSIWLAGLTDAWTNRTDIEGTLQKVTDENPVIVLTHNPDLFVLIPSRVILTLAGHTHGGQVNFPFFGRLKVPSEYGQRYAIGHIIENNHHLFVTSGIGTSIIPVRFRVPPEIVILTLKGGVAGGASSNP
ncbi:MAG: metallophosphoesterase [Acidobacteria bacterium]|jgi:predicted MPP superfamily phosphohydrolase|nr:metallophosphoesterase [Acidobacteriota bacterium]